MRIFEQERQMTLQIKNFKSISVFSFVFQLSDVRFLYNLHLFLQFISFKFYCNFAIFEKKNRLPFEKRKRLQTGFLQTDLWIKYALKSIEHGDTRVFSFPRNGKSLWQGLGFHLRKSLFYQGGVRNEVNSSRKLKSYQMDITAIWPKYDIFFGHAISKVTYPK